jgi:DNA replication protein DnaC
MPVVVRTRMHCRWRHRPSTRGSRRHSRLETRKSGYRRPPDAFSAKPGESARIAWTIDTELWQIPKRRHYVIGPTGIGKSWLACALAQKACRDGFSVLHKRTSELFRELAVAHADGSIGRFLVRLSRIDILLLDDFAMAPLKDAERRDFLEICDDRYQRRSMILTSQMPVAHWHEQIGDPTIADSILDRLIHNAYRIELKGDSMRKKRRKPGEEESQ